ncbi:MAG: FtsH protease activity modulator HflK [Deltaproteobacteria bacterium]|nr:FtsH protease activity modulator HflK [Deltaproteobacteria bacterium]
MAWDWDKLQQQKQGKPGAPPPQIDAVLEKIKEMKGRFPGSWIIIALIILVILAFTCIYTVGVNEVGVVQRFGKYIRTAQPGLNFKLPKGIEKVTKVNVKLTFKEEFGATTYAPTRRSRYVSPASSQDESLMLTGDLNVVVVPWIVQYKIQDPNHYLFKIKDVIGTLRDLSESSMRLVVGDSSVDEVIKNRVEIATQAKDLLQKELNAAESGIRVENILMQETNVPEPVQPSFNQVNQAIQEKETMIFKANEAYYKVIPAAKGNAAKTIKTAEGYALDRVNRAKGDASRFTSIYEEYYKSKDVTRRRLYLEALQDILPKIGNKYIIDANQKNLLPLLNLGKAEGVIK